MRKCTWQIQKGEYLLPSYILSEAAHRCKTGLHQMANLLVEMIHIPGVKAHT